MINHIIDLLSGKVPTKEELSLLLKEAIDSEREITTARLLDYGRQLDNLQRKLNTVSTTLGETQDELQMLKSKYDQLKKNFENKIVSPKQHIQNSRNESSSEIQPAIQIQSKQVVAKRFFSQCTANGFSVSYALMGVDENHSSAYYVVYDDGANECDFEPISVKSTTLIMNKRDMLEPICEIENNGGNSIQIISKGRVLKSSGNNWIISTKCKIKI